MKFFLKNKIIVLSISALILVIAGIVFYAYFFSAKNKSGESNSGVSFSNFDLIKPIFAKVEEIASNKISPAIPFSKALIAGISNLDSFAEDGGFILTESQGQALEEDGFFLASNNIIENQSEWEDQDDFVDMYDIFDGSSNQYYREQDDAIFITSDLALHLYHILIDRSFQRMEETRFHAMLKSMTEALFIDSINNYNNTDDAVLKESYKRLSVYYLIPLVILDSGSQQTGDSLRPEDFDTFAQYLDSVDNMQIANSEQDLQFSLSDKNYKGFELSEEIYNLAKSELNLIQKAEGWAASPLFTPSRPDFRNDYSQFKPRSHYTKNDVLKSYFIAMMWYGRMGFTINSPDLTRDALIITGQVNNLEVGDEKLSDLWSDMSAVISFFVGEEDDLTAYHYTDLIKKVYGDGNISNKDFIDGEMLNEFISRAKEEMPLPKILSEVIMMPGYDSKTKQELLSETLQFRFMGQRFTPDAYIINSLTQGDESPDPETGQKLPTMPTALMPMHIIAPNNQIIKNYLDEWINDPERIEYQERQSDKIIAKVINILHGEFSEYQNDVWTQNIYWSWLDCFRSLLFGYGEGYPYFMQTDSWMKKNLGTVLGSFTELKHDTLLYAKQSYAELGGGAPDNPELPPVVKGYVEPDLDFWNKIITLAQITVKGLEDREVFPEEFKYKYQSFIESAEFFRQIAEQELQNKEISDEDFEKLRTINSDLKQIVSPIAGQDLTTKEKRAGIIADIHTDAVKSQVLYEATGKPFIIYVAVKDINGTRLTRGAVFNHYEFSDKLDERLSDEDWQAKVYESGKDLPDGDSWSSELIK